MFLTSLTNKWKTVADKIASLNNNNMLRIRHVYNNFSGCYNVILFNG